MGDAVLPVDVHYTFTTKNNHGGLLIINAHRLASSAPAIKREPSIILLVLLSGVFHIFCGIVEISFMWKDEE